MKTDTAIILLPFFKNLLNKWGKWVEKKAVIKIIAWS